MNAWAGSQALLLVAGLVTLRMWSNARTRVSVWMKQTVLARTTLCVEELWVDWIEEVWRSTWLGPWVWLRHIRLLRWRVVVEQSWMLWPSVRIECISNWIEAPLVAWVPVHVTIAGIHLAYAHSRLAKNANLLLGDLGFQTSLSTRWRRLVDTIAVYNDDGAR